MTYFIGLDPGLTGAIALLNGKELLAVHDLPTMFVGKGEGRVKNQINAAAFNELLYQMTAQFGVQMPRDKPIAYIEKVSSMPDQGIAGAFSLGDTVGCLRGVVVSNGLPIEWVTPQAWKKHFRLPKEKDVARSVAINLYPSAPLNLKKHHNRAEAILIARYAYDRAHAASSPQPF